MKSYTSLMQSKYFNSTLNSAIFDGPVRIYFSQVHESVALKIYFLLQQLYSNELSQSREYSKALGTTLFVMLYPSTEIYENSFSENTASFTLETFDGDSIVGVRSPIVDQEIPELVHQMGQVFKSWGAHPALNRGVEL